MPREIDTRDLAYVRADGERLASLGAHAAALSDALPPGASLRAEGLNPTTGSTVRLVSEGGQPVRGPLIAEALRLVRDTAPALGFAPAESVEFVPDPHILSTSAGVTVVNLHQVFQGLRVFQMGRAVRFGASSSDSSSAFVASDVIGNHAPIPEYLELVPRVNVVEAVKKAAAYAAEPDTTGDVMTDMWGQAIPVTTLDVCNYEPEILASFEMPSRPTVLTQGPFAHVVMAELLLFDQVPEIRLGWRVMLTMPDGLDRYEMIVSADRDEMEILYCQSKTTSLTQGSIFQESPNRTPRELIPFPRPISDYPVVADAVPEDFPTSWCDLDRTAGDFCVAMNSIDATSSYQGATEGSNILFTPSDPTGSQQHRLNLFYFCNYLHDFYYLLGFDEKSGNFQRKNVTPDGLPGDPVLAKVYPGPISKTAVMQTDPDGISPSMSVGTVRGPSGHGALDADVIFHEYTHGLTNRLVGGPLNTSALDQPQSRGMGEGWSDYFALTIQNFGKANERTKIGNEVAANPRPGGIREFPYDENFPDGFGAIGRGRYTNEHNLGEIWGAALMQMNRELGRALGSSERGHRVGWQIVVDGLKLSPSNPSFLASRDAILLALDHLRDADRLSETDYVLCRRAAWGVFAQFGMGINAISNGSSLAPPIADFTLPDGI